MNPLPMLFLVATSGEVRVLLIVTETVEQVTVEL